MEKFLNFSTGFHEQLLLRAYYMDAPEWEKFLANDKTPDVFKTENELIKKEYAKRYTAAVKKMYGRVKSCDINKYVTSEKAEYQKDFISFYFDFDSYYKDTVSDAPLYTACSKVEVEVTMVKKLFRKVEKKTVTTYYEITFSDDVVKMSEVLKKPFAYLCSTGIIKDDYIDPVIELGYTPTGNKEKIKTLYSPLTETTFKHAVSQHEGVASDVEKVVPLTKPNPLGKMYLTENVIMPYFYSKKQIGDILGKYFSLNLITADEIEATLETHETKAEFNEWLEERLKTVVVSDERLIEKSYL